MANKITKRDNFMAIIEVLREQGKEDLVKVMEHEVELIANKSGKKSEKTCAEQSAMDNSVLGVMTTDFVSVTEIYKKLGMPDGVTVPKVTASLGRLVKAGKVTNRKDSKGSAYALVGATSTPTVEE